MKLHSRELRGGGAFGQVTLAPDEFNSGGLDTTAWALVNGSVAASGAELLITSPTGNSHEATTSGNTLVRVMRRASGDFTASAKFDSIPVEEEERLHSSVRSFRRT